MQFGQLSHGTSAARAGEGDCECKALWDTLGHREVGLAKHLWTQQRNCSRSQLVPGSCVIALLVCMVRTQHVHVLRSHALATVRVDTNHHELTYGQATNSIKICGSEWPLSAAILPGFNCHQALALP